MIGGEVVGRSGWSGGEAVGMLVGDAVGLSGGEGIVGEAVGMIVGEAVGWSEGEDIERVDRRRRG